MRKTFVKANARKAIAPTQFNPQSTRGHCVMTLECEMPKPDDASVKQRGRIYVCDLAGTEPAGDVFYAIYEKVKQPDGTIELLNPKPHQDQDKTKKLQDQGKKINLSLSEMAQFFMKMAEAIKKKKLKIQKEASNRYLAATCFTGLDGRRHSEYKKNVKNTFVGQKIDTLPESIVALLKLIQTF